MPTRKAKKIDDLLTSISGISRQDADRMQICVFCKERIISFRNEISRREYEISGFCQECQDEIFGRD